MTALFSFLFFLTHQYDMKYWDIDTKTYLKRQNIISATYIMVVCEFLVNKLQNTKEKIRLNNIAFEDEYFVERIYQKLWKNDVSRKMIKYYLERFEISDIWLSIKVIMDFIDKTGIRFYIDNISSSIVNRRTGVVSKVTKKVMRLDSVTDKNEIDYNDLPPIIEYMDYIRKNYYDKDHVIESGQNYDFEKVKYD